MERNPEWYVLVVRDGAEKPLVYGRDWRFFRVYNRFDEPYVKRVRRRFRILEYLSESHHFVHIVLTVKHKGSRAECCKLLATYWNRFRSFLLKRIGSFMYVRVLEAHRDGYPHMHVLLFTKRYIIDQKELSLWCENHGLGRIVWIKRYWSGRYGKRKPIAYLTKYLSKQFKRDEWDAGTLVFYSILWKHRIRSYGFSHGFADVRSKFKVTVWRQFIVCDYETMVKTIQFFVSNKLWCWGKGLLYSIPLVS